jgi:hypothetical protein
MLTLGQRQRLFVRLLGSLEVYAYSRGYELTLGSGFRPDGRGHMPGSLHYVKLAQDLNLFVKGVYIETAHAAWRDLGAYWKALHPLCCWGGDFRSKDYNHVSITFQGRALRPVLRGAAWFPVKEETACMTPDQRLKTKAERKMLKRAEK